MIDSFVALEFGFFLSFLFLWFGLVCLFSVTTMTRLLYLSKVLMLEWMR